LHICVTVSQSVKLRQVTFPYADFATVGHVDLLGFPRKLLGLKVTYVCAVLHTIANRQWTFCLLNLAKYFPKM